MMERIGFFCLLLCGSIHMISNATSTLETPSTKSSSITNEGADKSAPTSNASSNNKNEEKATSTLQTPSTESINITNEGAERSALQPISNALSNNKNEEKGTNNITASITATEAATTTPTSKTNSTGTNATETATTTSTSTTNITGTNATETAMTTTKSTTNSTETKATETAMTTTTSTTNKTNRTGTTAPKTATNTTHHSSGGTTQVLGIFLITVTVGCCSAVVLILYSLRYFYKKKVHAVKRNQEHFYDSIDDFATATQFASDRKNTQENIYYLATFPGAQKTDNQQITYETIYPLKDSTPKEEDEQLYTHVIKPKE
ncbi:cell wall protein DAN4-like isoform X3 [Pygocentrus nattereri]|uniref:cell wall protein DAN4-like isoform X3 n=1 Tax=Pygocentrus nattereri TaxID=42514 RepID=UPI001890E02C|nr:cell wall protein DAN4-like isoform X3 [Pygocentrus nattereri]